MGSPVLSTLSPPWAAQYVHLWGCPVRPHLAVTVGQAFGAAACVAPHDRPDPPEAHDRSEDGHAVHLVNADTNAG